MIVTFTASDRKQFRDISSDYQRRIKETKELIEKLRPGDRGPKGPSGAKAGTPEEEEFNKNWEEWLSSGSPEWREARKQYLKLIDERLEALNSFYNQVERREFSKLGEDREKIIESAKDQINLLIDNRFKSYKKIISTHKNEDGEEITSFSANDLRVDGSDIYLDTEKLIRDSRRSLLKLHFEALSHDQEATKEIEDLIFTIISESPKTSSDKGVLGATVILEGRKKPRSKKKLPTFSEFEQDFFAFPTTQSSDAVFDLLSSDGDTKETVEKLNKISKRKVAKQYTDTKKRSLMIETEKTLTLIELYTSGDVNGRTAKKIFYFILNEIYQKAYYKEKLNDGLLTFPLQKMVDKKLYTSTQNARRAFHDARKTLQTLNVNGYVKSGKIEISFKEGDGGGVVLFPSMWVEKGQCIVRLNQDMNWSPFLKDFFLMPDSWWALPDHASDLEYKIFRRCRMNKEKINKNGILTFDVSLSSVATWLNLPLDTENPKRDVKIKIETAVKQISDSLDPNNFKIEIKTDLNASLTQYLSGFLKVTMGGAYTHNLIDINEKQTRRIEQKARRKDSIIKEAKIRKLAEEMKKEEQKS